MTNPVFLVTPLGRRRGPSRPYEIFSCHFSHLQEPQLGTPLERIGPSKNHETRDEAPCPPGGATAALDRRCSAAAAGVRRAEPAEPGAHRGAVEPDPSPREHGERCPAPAQDGPHSAGNQLYDGA